MQRQIVALEEEKQVLSADSSKQHEQLEAAIAQHKSLSDKVAEVTKHLEQKCRDQITDADKTVAELQVNGMPTVLEACLVTCAFSHDCAIDAQSVFLQV